ncbi:hemolysin family protein [Halopenitus sp. POP-27]|uniref:hemolysin family protein n=1 Tax=Halopenitus sp. POP-27 TaxID=2994425 RepID=UPI002468AA8C|nr:hemolysin family protein [Halopenitus sp. POP-27]
MVDVALSVGRILLALVLVALNGFFVAAEFAYVRVRATSVESMVEQGKTGATLLQDAMDSLDDYLAVTQLGITIASLGLGWIGEPAMAALIEPVLGGFLPAELVHLVAFAIGFSVITFLHVVFGELAPKTIAIAQAERIALLVAAPMQFFYYAFLPGIIVFNGTANAFTRLLGVPPASETDETLTERELRMALSHAGEEGHVGAEEVEMIDRVFDLDDVTVREVMVPRPDVRTVTDDLTIPALRSVVVDAGHTRYPVVDADDPDQVVGLVDAKDVLRATETTGASDAEPTAGDISREIHAVPETTDVATLLSDLQGRNAQMAAVIDEWGVLAGIVTIEDIVEVVVGDIRDEFDVAGGESEPGIERREDGSLTVDGGVTITAVNAELGTALDHDAVETIGGIVLSRLDRQPTVGDRVTLDGYAFEVTDVEGMRVSTLVVRSESDGSGSEPGENSEPESDENPETEPSENTEAGASENTETASNGDTSGSESET